MQNYDLIRMTNTIWCNSNLLQRANPTEHRIVLSQSKM